MTPLFSNPEPIETYLSYSHTSELHFFLLQLIVLEWTKEFWGDDGNAHSLFEEW